MGQKPGVAAAGGMMTPMMTPQNNAQMLAQKQKEIAQKQKEAQEARAAEAKRKTEEMRVKMEEVKKKKEEEMVKKKEADAKRMEELKHANEVRKVLMKVRQATVDNFDTLKEELETIMAAELPHCGEQSDKITKEAEPAVELASNKLEAL